MTVFKNSHHDKDWSIVSSEYLFKRPWLTVRKDEVRLPDGRIMPEYYVLEYPTWINVIAITEDGEMVLVRQYRHGIGETRLELCAGVVDDGESPLDGAKRELLEETGYAGGEWEELMVVSANPSTMNNVSHSFVAKGVKRVAGQNLDPTEDIDVVLMSQDDVFGLLRDGEFVQSLMAAPLWKYFYLTKTENGCN